MFRTWPLSALAWQAWLDGDVPVLVSSLLKYRQRAMSCEIHLELLDATPTLRDLTGAGPIRPGTPEALAIRDARTVPREPAACHVASARRTTCKAICRRPAPTLRPA